MFGIYEVDRKKIFSKNGCFQDDKTFWSRFRQVIECDRPHKLVYKGLQAILIFTVELIGAIFLEPKRLLKIQIFEKERQISSEKGDFGPFFLLNIAYKKPQATTHKG